MKQILFISIVIILIIVHGCNMRLYTKNRPNIDSVNIFIYSSKAYSASGFSDLNKSYQSYKLTDNKTPINTIELNRLNLIIKNALPYYLVEGIIGGSFAFMQTFIDGNERGFYFYIDIDGKKESASIYDIQTKRLYKVKNSNDIWFLYELSNKTQNNTQLVHACGVFKQQKKYTKQCMCNLVYLNSFVYNYNMEAQANLNCS